METVLLPPPAGPSPPPPPPRLFTSSLNFICATLAGMRTLKKKKKATRSQPGSSSGGAMWHQATAKGEKKVLLATQTWRNSCDMPVSRSSPTFFLSAAEHRGRQPRAPCGGRPGAPGECEGGRPQRPPGKRLGGRADPSSASRGVRGPFSPPKVGVEPHTRVPEPLWARCPHPAELTGGLDMTPLCFPLRLLPPERGENDAHVDSGSVIF